ncbi:DUF930 domain-containing protein [Ochrobactrum quorumnocens]|uniref:DUF930 domain-containing protein n=1 Tax=Ochrobactrum quorumnocens TaxID=271865 RepID=UPI000A52EF0F
MQHLTKRTLEETGWGIPASVVLHLTLASLLLYRAPELSPPAQDQSVNVELVPPKPGAPSPNSKSNAAARRSPQAFESASAQKESPSPADSSQPVMDKPEPQQTAADNHNPVLKEKDEALQKSDSNAKSVPELRTKAEGLPVETKNSAPAAQNSIATPDKHAEVNSKLTSAQQIYSKDTLADPRVKQAIGKLPQRDRIVQICGIEALEQVRHHRPGTFPDMLAPSAGVVSETSFTIRDGAFRSRAKWYSIDFQCQVDTKAMKITDFSYLIGKAIPEVQWNSRQLPRD